MYIPAITVPCRICVCILEESDLLLFLEPCMFSTFHWIHLKCVDVHPFRPELVIYLMFFSCVMSLFNRGGEWFTEKNVMNKWKTFWRKETKESGTEWTWGTWKWGNKRYMQIMSEVFQNVFSLVSMVKACGQLGVQASAVWMSSSASRWLVTKFQFWSQPTPNGIPVYCISMESTYIW